MCTNFEKIQGISESTWIPSDSSGEPKGKVRSKNPTPFRGVAKGVTGVWHQMQSLVSGKSVEMTQNGAVIGILTIFIVFLGNLCVFRCFEPKFTPRACGQGVPGVLQQRHPWGHENPWKLGRNWGKGQRSQPNQIKVYPLKSLLAALRPCPDKSQKKTLEIIDHPFVWWFQNWKIVRADSSNGMPCAKFPRWYNLVWTPNIGSVFCSPGESGWD